MTLPLVVKLGGAVLDRLDCLQDLLAQIHATTRPVVLVHGGGALVDELLAKLGWSSQKMNGLRVTPFEQMDVIAGALSGTANKRLLAQAKLEGILSVGLSLSDGNLCEVSRFDPQLQAVGSASKGDAKLLNTLLSAGYLPIISSIGIDGTGQLLNVNADQAAVAIAETLGAELLLLSDVAAVLDGNLQPISQLSRHNANALITEGVIKDGMIVKVRAALAAAEALGRPINVAGWQENNILSRALSGESVGTQFTI